jgi:hypothetical protein
MKIETKNTGPDTKRMKLEIFDLTPAAKLLNGEALTFRYEKLFLAGKKK